MHACIHELGDISSRPSPSPRPSPNAAGLLSPFRFPTRLRPNYFIPYRLRPAPWFLIHPPTLTLSFTRLSGPTAHAQILFGAAVTITAASCRGQRGTG